MVVYLDNTVYTNYCLQKICQNIAGDYSKFSFQKIKIGSGDSTLSQERTDISEFLYTLKVKKTEYKDGVLTIRCDIPPELADIPITEIGLYDTYRGIDYLFSYSKVEIVKPADLNYELTVVLNLGPRTIDFPGKNEFYINKPEYATRDELGNFIDMSLIIQTDLERIVRKNAEILGYNLAEVAYERQRDITTMLKDSTYANIYYNLCNKYGSGIISDLFFLDEPNYLAYDTVNFADENSYLSTYLNLFDSNRDHFTFHNGPVTFLWSTQLQDTETASTIFNKRDNTNLYFSVDIVQNFEIYRINKPTPESVATYDNALYNEMVITLYGMTGSYTITYVFDKHKLGQYLEQQIPFALTFNGSFVEPEFHFYFNGVEATPYDAPTEFDTLEEQERRQESDMYGKVIYGNPLQLINMPDYSDMCHLKNYLVNPNTGEKTSYENALGNRVLMTLKKQCDKHDIAFISNVIGSLGELGISESI